MKPNIVILDGFTIISGSLSMEKWNKLGKTTVFDRTEPELVVERAKEADIILTNKVLITRPIMKALPRLRYIGVLATGYNVVDLKAAKEHGIVVTNIPAYSTASVAQLVFAHLLNICNNVGGYNQLVQQGVWQHSSDFCLTSIPQMELMNLTMGIVGLGNIGKAVARIAQSMGMKVMAVSSRPAEELAQMGIEKATNYESLFQLSDVISLHCPLTEETHHLVNAERLSLMKPSAILINTGRGPLVDEQALADALNEGRIFAAGVDVLSEEPPHSGSPLIGAHNCHITPHIAWSTKAARERLLTIAYENIKAFLEGMPQNVVG